MIQPTKFFGLPFMIGNFYWSKTDQPRAFMNLSLELVLVVILAADRISVRFWENPTWRTGGGLR